MQKTTNTDRISLPHLLMIAGQQQNVGKTTFACMVISHFSRKHPISALKVTPHFHKNTGKAEVFVAHESYQILKESSIDSNKDSSRMLKAGAEEAYLIQAEPEHLEEALNRILELIPEQNLIVCESAGLRDIVDPGLFLVLRQLNCQKCSIESDIQLKSADRIITFTGSGFDLLVEDIRIDHKKWTLKN